MTYDGSERTDRSPLLDVREMSVRYLTRLGTVNAVNNISFTLDHGETLGIIGESGCGKSTLAKAILGLVRSHSGSILYNGVDLRKLNARQLRRMRQKLQLISQNPRSALNPRFKVLENVIEPLRIAGIERLNARRRGEEVMEAVGLDPVRHGNNFSTNLSGGQCQRAAIARALLSGAEILICDESVSALDASLKATVLNLLRSLQNDYRYGMIFISHELPVVKNISDRTLVMYLGNICEVATTSDLFGGPKHPYTEALMRVVPEPDPSYKLPRDVLQGEVPSPISVPDGCAFRSRCPISSSLCVTKPMLRASASCDHLLACHNRDFE